MKRIIKEVSQLNIRPLEVYVYGNSRDDFEFALKIFKNLVNKERILSDFKDKQRFEKPSDKKRRKKREAVQRRMASEMKQQQIVSGEWDKIMKKKAARKKSRNRFEDNGND